MKWLRFRHVKKIAKGTMGEVWESKSRRGFKVYKFFDVRISLRENKRMVTYAKTVLHELIHIIFFLLQSGARYAVTTQSEHDFIDAMEDSLVAHWHLLKEKSKKRRSYAKKVK